MLSQDQTNKKFDISPRQILTDGSSRYHNTLQIKEYFGIFLIALAARLLNIFFIDDVAIHANIEDSSIYLSGAKSWIESGFFSITTDTGFSDQTERMPGYFVFLIPFVSTLENNIMFIIAAQSFVDAISCVLIARLAAFIDPLLGITSGVTAALWHNTILHSSLILTETIFLFLLCCLLVAAAFFLTTSKLRYAMLAGLICGLAISTRTVAIFLPFSMASAALVIALYKRQKFSRGLLAATLIIAFCTLPLTSVLQRNIEKYNTIQLTSQNGVFLLNWVIGQIKANQSGRGFDAESSALNEKLSKQLQLKHENPSSLNPFELSKERIELAKVELELVPASAILTSWVRGAIQNLASPAIANDPRIRRLNEKSFYNSEGKNIFEKAFNFIVDNNSTFVTILIIGLLISFIFSIAQLFGFFLLIKRHKWAATFGLLYILYFLLISGPVGNAKYRIPIEPALIIFQSAFFVQCFNRFFKKLKSK